MSDTKEPGSGKKHRIIHWNPDAGREKTERRWTWKRMLAWSVGGFFGLLIAAGIVVRAGKLVFGPHIFNPAAAAIAAAENRVDPGAAFISQAKAEQAHEIAAKALAELRKLPKDHPVQLQQFIVIEKTLLDGQAALASRDFGRAFIVFDNLNREIDEFSRNVRIKGDVQQSYNSILARISELELARSLAPGALEVAYEAAGTGKKLLDDGNFTGAKRIFDRGFLELKKAEQALTNHVRESLLNGQKALMAGQKDVAKAAFEAAMEKSPGNEQAIQGLKRAENIDRVYALLKQGENLEKQGQYAQAAESYQRAFALDSFSAAAQEGQSRAARLEKETKFAAAEAAAESAVKAKDWPKAISEFENALKVYPQKKDVQAKLNAAKESAHKEAVQKSLAQAYAHENVFEWQQARDAYGETMKLDPNLDEAKEGYKRAGTVIRALLEYEKLIEHSEQLANKAEFQAAIRIFNNAMAVKPSYLVNSDRVQQLHALLMSQNQPVEVTFRSDGETWVSINNFRAPSKFRVATMRFLPGDYEVIGRRRGYRDVQMLLQVRNGMPPPMVTVTCEVSAGRI
ncbi:MAG: tetratricopeptide repeat protein [Opitutus sp.]